jgi:ABC-type nitrate/sulfonate/bicarbonate transport system substrate-binding protein
MKHTAQLTTTSQNGRVSPLALSLIAIILLGVGIAIANYTGRKTPLKPEPSPVEIVEITAGYLPMVSSLTYFVAEEKGFFAKHNLKIKPRPLPTSNAIAEDLIRGNIDVAIELSVVPLLTATTGQPRFRIFSTSIITTTNGFDGVIVRGDSPIKAFKDLSGKRVLLFPGTTAERTFTQVFRKQFPDLPLPLFSQKPPTQHLQALLREECDAVHAYEPFIAEGLVEHGCRLVYGSVYGQQLSPSPIGVGAVNARWLQNNPAVAARFFAAMDEAVRFIAKDLDQSREIIARWTDKRMQVAEKMNIMPMSPTSELDQESLRKYIDLLVEMKEIDAPLSVKDICINPKP